MTRNPLLALVRRYLEGFSTSRTDDTKAKLCFLLKEYFIKDIYRQTGAVSVNFPTLAGKTHWFEAVYLLIYYNRAALPPA